MPIDESAGPMHGEWNGFLGSRGSLMLDLVFLALFFVVPVMFWSIAQVRQRRRFEFHARLQTGLGMVLALTVLVFELDVRLHGWRHRAEPSRFWREGPWNDPIDWSLLVHLIFAIPTPLIWTFVIVRAWQRFPRPARPGSYSRRHRWWGRLAAVTMTMTAVTGWIFYVLAFVA
jgi:uncharacterized membrane protein YozB (DUF420 family)